MEKTRTAATFGRIPGRGTPWYRRPWVMVLASLLTSIVVMSTLGISPGDGAPSGVEQSDA